MYTIISKININGASLIGSIIIPEGHKMTINSDGLVFLDEHLIMNAPPQDGDILSVDTKT